MNKSSITINNVGAIKYVKIDINQINVIIGEQSSGKSTILKLICFCQWVEKRCALHFENNSIYFSNGSTFLEEFISYYRMEGYFTNDSSFEYNGSLINIVLNKGHNNVQITLVPNPSYQYPKIEYIPSERNFVTTIPNINKYNETNDVIMYFLYDWNSARRKFNSKSLSAILNSDISYSFENEDDYITTKDYKLSLRSASSGLQSIIPMYVVSNYLINEIYKEKRAMSIEQLVASERVMISEASKGVKFDKEASVYKFSNLFIEEPEQNLFPEAQRNFVYQIIKDIKQSQREHSLFFSTHSPYILFALNNCLLGGLVGEKIPREVCDKFASRRSWIDPEKVSIWQLENGMLRKLQDKDGILEDNYFNREMNKTNNEYINMLSYYDEE